HAPCEADSGTGLVAAALCCSWGLRLVVVRLSALRVPTRTALQPLYRNFGAALPKSSPRRIWVGCAAEFDAQRRAGEREALAEPRFQVAAIRLRHVAQPAAVHDDDRRILPALVRVAQLRPSGAPPRRRLALDRLVQRARELRRGDPGHRRRVGRLHRAHQRGDAESLECGDEMPLREAQEVQSAVELAAHALAPVGVGEIPFVHRDDERTAGLEHVAGDRRILVGDVLGRIEQQDADVGVLDRLQRLHRREFLDRLVDAAASAQAGGVDPRVRAPAEHFWVACSPRLRRRRPAVSPSVCARPPCSKSTATASRVVPGWSKATSRSSPMSALISVDLPTLGRPTTATRTRAAGSAAGPSPGWPGSPCPAAPASSLPGGARRARRAPFAGTSAGADSGGTRKGSSACSTSSRTPSPCAAETAIGSPSPSWWN